MASTTADSAKDESVVPKMSVIIATREDFACIRKTVQHLRAQTVRHQLELVIVTVSAEQFRLEEWELADFAAFQLVGIEPVPLESCGECSGRKTGANADRGFCRGSLLSRTAVGRGTAPPSRRSLGGRRAGAPQREPADHAQLV